MTTVHAFSPLLRHSFDVNRFNDLFEIAFNEKNKNIKKPAYDIIKNNQTTYTLKLLTAGFKNKEINIEVENNILKITGKKNQEQKNNKEKFLHKGIREEDFKIDFQLSEHMKVQSADLNDGLLFINLVVEVPEEKKPQVININSHQ